MYLHVKGINLDSIIFLLDFGTVLTSEVFFFFHFNTYKLYKTFDI